MAGIKINYKSINLDDDTRDSKANRRLVLLYLRYQDRLSVPILYNLLNEMELETKEALVERYDNDDLTVFDKMMHQLIFNRVQDILSSDVNELIKDEISEKPELNMETNADEIKNVQKEMSELNPKKLN